MVSIQGLIPSTLSQLVLILLTGCVAYYLSWIIYTRYFHPLHHVPGPILASITSWWYFYGMFTGKKEMTQLALHKRYGKVVRINPSTVAIGDATAVPVVFGTSPVWKKTEFYAPMEPHFRGRVELFSTRDEDAHADRRRIVAHLWNPKALVDYEPRVNRIIEKVVSRLDRAGRDNEVVQIDRLQSQFASDVIGEVFWGKQDGFGAVEQDIEYQNWRTILWEMLPPLGSIAWAPKGMRTGFVLTFLAVSAKPRRGIMFLKKLLAECSHFIKLRNQQEEDDPQMPRDNLISRMLEIVREKGEKIDFNQDDVTLHMLGALTAGFDTTSLVLTGILCNIVANPQIYDKLQQELQVALKAGSLDVPVKYSDALKLPYLSACIKEGMRYEPTHGGGFPRTIPLGGVIIAGLSLPGGYDVSMNFNSLNFDAAVYGEDADIFRPERWIDSDQETLTKMNRFCQPFGFGTRDCIGKNLARMELYKLVATLFAEFEFETVREPVKYNYWWRRIENAQMKVKRNSHQL